MSAVVKVVSARDGFQRPRDDVPVRAGRVDLNRFFAGWVNVIGWRRSHWVLFDPVRGMTPACGATLPSSESLPFGGHDSTSWVVWPSEDHDAPPHCKRCLKHFGDPS